MFLDEQLTEAIANARSVCGNDSQCIYDFSQTGNEELAMVSMTPIKRMFEPSDEQVRAGSNHNFAKAF